MWLLVGALALAQEPAALRLHEAMLEEALDGDLEAAIRTYRELSRNLPVESPTRPDALYQLGVALAALGRVDEARDALQDGIRAECSACRTALEELEIEQHAVRELPTVWPFDSGGHGVFHPIDAQQLGAMRMESQGGRDALQWRTGGRPGEDRLVIGLAVGAHELRLRAMSQDQTGLLGVRVEDDHSRRWVTAEPLVFEADRWQEVVVDLEDLSALEPDGSRPSADHLVRIELLDRTGLRRAGAVTWWIDAIEIR
ncbi:MAG: tetratricopeptide repeat protein [Alphaproteobacteria bacterium]|nr:tetratricopeptide repeat protein [Alphaproteobacteria bacterium]